ncbi:MAG: hypothetical protein JWP87_4356 [Labilithrix sp.]|nr:hypothetical protein [Labilithrix sp.]
MRRGLLVTLASLAAACTQACAEGSSPEGLESTRIIALSDPGHASLPDVDEASPADKAREPDGPSFAKTVPFAITSCKKGAFCDDFEDATPGSRWTSSIAADGVVDFIGPSSSFGVHALRATTHGAGASAYLSLAGAPLGTQWVGVLGFSLRVDSLPTTVLGGPEIAVLGSGGAVTRVGFSVLPTGIALHQHAGACSGASCTSRSDVVAGVKPGEWTHLVVAIETTGTTAPPYGRIEVTVDGGELLLLPLTVTPFDGKAEARAGITVGDSAPATARVDDVIFYTH